MGNLMTAVALCFYFVILDAQSDFTTIKGFAADPEFFGLVVLGGFVAAFAWWPESGARRGGGGNFDAQDAATGGNLIDKYKLM